MLSSSFLSRAGQWDIPDTIHEGDSETGQLCVSTIHEQTNID